MLSIVNSMHSCQRKCICTSSLNACSDQVFAASSMLYLQIAPWDSFPVVLCTIAQTTAHCTVCRLHFAEYVEFVVFADCTFASLSAAMHWPSQSSAHYCSLCKSHCAVSCACAKLFSPPQITTIFHRVSYWAHTKCFLRRHLTGEVYTDCYHRPLHRWVDESVDIDGHLASVTIMDNF